MPYLGIFLSELCSNVENSPKLVAGELVVTAEGHRSPPRRPGRARATPAPPWRRGRPPGRGARCGALPAFAGPCRAGLQAREGGALRTSTRQPRLRAPRRRRPSDPSPQRPKRTAAPHAGSVQRPHDPPSHCTSNKRHAPSGRTDWGFSSVT